MHCYVYEVINLTPRRSNKHCILFRTERQIHECHQKKLDVSYSVLNTFVNPLDCVLRYVWKFPPSWCVWNLQDKFWFVFFVGYFCHTGYLRAFCTLSKRCYNLQSEWPQFLVNDTVFKKNSVSVVALAVWHANRSEKLSSEAAGREYVG